MPYILGSIYRNKMALSSGYLASSAPLDVTRPEALSTLQSLAQIMLHRGGEKHKEKPVAVSVLY